VTLQVFLAQSPEAKCWRHNTDAGRCHMVFASWFVMCSSYSLQLIWTCMCWQLMLMLVADPWPAVVDITRALALLASGYQMVCQLKAFCKLWLASIMVCPQCSAATTVSPCTVVYATGMACSALPGLAAAPHGSFIVVSSRSVTWPGLLYICI